MSGDFASIFHSIMAAQRPVDYETILSTPNMAEANFVRSALSILTDPDDEEDHDKDVVALAYNEIGDIYEQASALLLERLGNRA